MCNSIEIVFVLNKLGQPSIQALTLTFKIKQKYITSSVFAIANCLNKVNCTNIRFLFYLQNSLPHVVVLNSIADCQNCYIHAVRMTHSATLQLTSFYFGKRRNYETKLNRSAHSTKIKEEEEPSVKIYLGTRIISF